MIFADSVAALEGAFEEDEPGNNGLESRLPHDDPEEQEESVMMRVRFLNDNFIKFMFHRNFDQIYWN